ncbi:aldose 1-epimerase-like protein [Trypanosoma theileri]|uniref:Aldose 1-epimerase-like protein n=1 Tax=Trypanosoma theileri TaxID=67003 RepID=A0A1X0NJ33_9TRYP|nr:aldose 1-epimerase-like protein [Trypanosoma theileri]ORC84647.1 aldose 1-epimerase-like protein [Trypanosoma theileri]
MASFSVRVEKFGPGKLIRVHTPALRCAFATLGAAINSVKVWDARRSRWVEVNCAYNCPEEAAADTDYMGPTVGRYAGRISNGTFTLDGEEQHVSRNMDGRHTIHGGADAFNKRQWSYFILESEDIVGVRFSLVSPHMDQGFPAELHSYVFYYVERSKPNVLHTRFSAFIPEGSPADATVVNIFNHAYWNLNGLPERNTARNPRWTQPEKVLNIVLKMPCSRVVEADTCGIPTGNLKDVTGTCLDFRKGKPLGEDIDNKATLKCDPCGYDHPLVVDGWKESEKHKLLLNAVAYSPSSHIQMKVYSTFPSIWVYTANNKPANVSGRKGERYGRHTGVCLEPQHLPDCPNQPSFPSVVLRKGETWREAIVNEFNVVSDSHM